MNHHPSRTATQASTDQARLLRGQSAVFAAMRSAQRLLDEADVPFCGRAPWLSRWYAHSGRPSAAVLVERSGEPVGLACLATHRIGPLVTVTLAGDGPSDYGRLPVRDEPAAAALAHGLVDLLTGIRMPWRLRLSQVPVGDPVAGRLLVALPAARIESGQASPAMTFGPDRTPERHLATKCRRAARRGLARLAADGVTVSVDQVSTPAGVRDLLPDVVALHRERDRGLGRRSDLDSPWRRAFYLDTVTDLADAGNLDIWALRLDGTLGAYVIGVRDGRCYRTLDARMAERWQAVTPGQILRTEMITRLLADPDLVELDWMRGVLRHKTQDSTHVVAAEHLLAESSPLVTSTLRNAQRLRGHLRDRIPDQARRWIRSSRRPASHFPAARATPDEGRAAPRQPGAADDNHGRS